VHTQQAEIADRLSSPPPAPEEVEEEASEAFSPVEFPAHSETAPHEEIAEEPQAFMPLPIEEQIAQPSVVELAPVHEVTPALKPAAVPAPRRAPKARSAPGAKGKAAFTLRLDPDRHLKLRLACAIGARSAQQLVTDALDQLLAGMPELDAMAANAKRKGS
jgi:hypothetical protein